MQIQLNPEIKEAIQVVKTHEALASPDRMLDQGEIMALTNAFEVLSEALEGQDKVTPDNRTLFGYLAVCYLEGLGCEPDIEKARDISEAAAKWIDPAARYALGMTLLNRTPEENADLHLKRAAFSIESAAKQGFAPAVYALSHMYEEGVGVSQNLEHATQLLQDSAEAGYPPAQFELAESLKNHDVPSSRHWAEKAAVQGYKPATKILEEIREQTVSKVPEYALTDL